MRIESLNCNSEEGGVLQKATYHGLIIEGEVLHTLQGLSG